MLGLLLAGCAGGAQAAPAGHPVSRVAATAAPPATPMPEPTATPVPAPPPTQAPPPAPAPPPPPAVRTFGLGGHGSVQVTDNGGSATITVSIFGLAAVGHAVHLHSGCTGNGSAHIATIGTVGSSGTVAITLPSRFLGATVIVYPNTSATGNPILCGATA